MHAQSAVADLDASIADDLEEAWADIQPSVVRRLMIAATQEFWIRGYHATTTRDIARRAGLSPAGVYVHFTSKEEVLFRITLFGHQQSLAQITASVAGVADPFDRLRAMVSGFSAWHASFHAPAKVIEYELHALSDEHFAEIARCAGASTRSSARRSSTASSGACSTCRTSPARRSSCCRSASTCPGGTAPTATVRRRASARSTPTWPSGCSAGISEPCPSTNVAYRRPDPSWNTATMANSSSASPSRP